MTSWQLSVLGNITFTRQDKTIQPDRMSAAILTYLALEGPTPRSKLAGLLWPESLESTARNNLSQRLRRLRQQLNDSVIEGDELLQLSPRVSVDVTTHKEALLSGQSDEIDTGGELLASYDYDDCPEFSDWLYGERETLQTLEKEALEAMITSHEARGQLGKALRYAERLEKLEPLSEAAYRHLMRLHYLTGDKAAALAAYKRCVAVLKEELRTEPLPETQELAREIERGLLQTNQPTQRKTIPLSLQRPPVLVGRESEWERMEQAWEAGQTIYLTGEPGVGKTRLAQDFVASKGKGIYLPARPGYQDVPFAAAASLARTRLAAAPDVVLPQWVRRELARILPEFQEGIEPLPLRGDEDRLRFFQAYLEMVRFTGKEFIASISDDTQYYDQATVELGGFMMSQRSSASAGANQTIPRYIVIYRRGELPATSQVIIDRLVSSGIATRIDLQPLDTKATTSLLVSLKLESFDDGVTPHLAETVYRRTGGNALFILETVRNLVETHHVNDVASVPATSRVETIVQQRLARLSPTAQRVVQTAAILQSDFDLELIGKVLNLEPFDLINIWEELERAQIFQGSRFSHDLLYEAVLAGISEPIKAVLHKRCAEALTERKANPARIAKHWLATGDDLKAIPALLEAAEFSSKAFRMGEALTFYEEAVLRQERVRDDRVFNTLLKMVELYTSFSTTPNHQVTVSKLKQLATTTEQKVKFAAAEAQLYVLLGEGDKAENAARAGLGLSEELKDEESYRKLTYFLLYALSLQNRNEEALGLALKTLAARERKGISAREVAFWLNPIVYFLLELERHDEALGYSQQALALNDKHDHTLLKGTHLHSLALSQYYQGQVKEALATLMQEETLLENTEGANEDRRRIGNLSAVCHRELGEYKAALETFTKAQTMTKELGTQTWSRIFVQRELAYTYALLGAWQEAEQHIEELLQEKNIPPWRRVQALVVKARISRVQGRETKRVLEEIEELSKDFLRPWAKILYALEQAAESSSGHFAKEALELSQQYQLKGLEIASHTRYAQTLLHSSKKEQALEQTTLALELLQTYQCTDFYLGEVYWTHYQGLKANARDDAKSYLETIATWLQETTEQHGPEKYRQSFLSDNPTNKAILEAFNGIGLEAK
jgi:DNA-binding SARP family transcriptional activator/predicted ATPase